METINKTFFLSDKAIVVVLGSLISSILKLALPIILVRLITKGEYGSYSQVMLLYSTFGIIFLLGIPQSIYYFIPQLSQEKRGGFILQSYILLFIFGAVLTLSFYLLSNSIGRWFNNDMLPHYIKIFSPYFMFMMPIQSLSPLLISTDRHKEASIAMIALAVIFVVSVLAPLFFGCSLELVFRSIVVFACIQFVLVTFYIRKRLFGDSDLHSVTPDGNLTKRQIGYAFPIGMSGAVGIASRVIDKYVISGFFTPAQFAIYAIGARELPLVGVLPYSISNVIQPKLVEYYNKGEQDKFINLWHESVRKISLIILPVSVLLFVIAQQFITLLYTGNYIESTSIFRIYLCSLPVRVTAYGPVLMAMGHPRLVLGAAFIGLCLNLVLNFFFLHIIGFVGPAVATVFTIYAITIFYLLKISSLAHISLVEVFPFKEFLKVLGVAGLCGFFVYLISFLEVSNLAIFCLQIVIFGVCYTVIIRKLGLLRDSDVRTLKAWCSLKQLRLMFTRR